MCPYGVDMDLWRERERNRKAFEGVEISFGKLRRSL